MLYTLVSIQTLIYCSLWMGTTPTLADWITNCPSFNYRVAVTWPSLGLDVDNYFFMRAVEIDSGAVLCEVPAFHHFGLLPCPGMQPVDAYEMQLIWRDAESWICTVFSEQPPDLSACPDRPADARLEWRGPFPVPEPPAVSSITPPRPDFPSVASLATADDLEFLSYWMAWYGLSDPIAWQNQWDESILGAAFYTNVPPGILKSVIGQETQFWPMWTGVDGEVGLIQITWEGADNALRHSPALYARYCQRAIWWGYCKQPYDLLAGWMQGRLAAALVADLTLSGTPLERAAQVSDDLVTYARILAAYYTYTAALGFEGWDYALAAFNAGGKCIATGSICPEGQEYVRKVMK